MEKILELEIQKSLNALKEPNSNKDNYRCYFEGRMALAKELIQSLTEQKPPVENISEALTEKKHQIEYAEKCRANWQVSNSGGGYIVKCRECGTTLCSNGTPKCLLTASEALTGEQERWISVEEVQKLLKMQIEECRVYIDRRARDFGQSSFELHKWFGEIEPIELPTPPHPVEPKTEYCQGEDDIAFDFHKANENPVEPKQEKESQ